MVLLKKKGIERLIVFVNSTVYYKKMFGKNFVK